MVHEVGFPALLKAAAGGGGKGIRILRDAEAICTTAAMREGRNAFGDPSLLVERPSLHAATSRCRSPGDGRGAVLLQTRGSASSLRRSVGTRR
ncbi:MAG: hypothetical protein U1E90_00215 [Burkholderiaceae bacterium]